MINCANHSMREADYHCSRCQTGLCRDCINVKAFDRVKLEVCPTCGNPVTNLAPFKPVEPFWERIPQFLFWPLQGDSRMLLVGWGVFSLPILGLKSFCIAIPFVMYAILGVILTSLIYYGLLIPYFYRVIAKSEEGDFSVPDFAAFGGFWDSFVLILRFGMGCLAVFWPMAAFFIILLVLEGGSFSGAGMAVISPLGIMIFGLAGLAGLAFLPMALLIMGVFGNPGLVLNPVYMVSQIKKILMEYLIALAMIGGLLMVYTGVRIVFHLVMAFIHYWVIKYILFFPIDGVLQLYLFMVIGHLLGYMAYQCRYKLKWAPGILAEPVFMVGGRAARLEYSRGPAYRIPPPSGPATRPMASAPGRAAATLAAGAAGVAAGAAGAVAAAMPPGGADAEELARRINDGMSMIEHGRFEEASALFQEVLSKNPTHLGALRGMAMTSLRMKDMEKFRQYSQQQGAELVRQQVFEVLWELVTETKKSVPGFTLTSKDQFALARWLAGRNLHLDAAKALREVAVAYPDDPLSPKALYQCGELLRDRCSKPDAAAQMFDYILKRYPEVAFADQVRAALGKLKPGG